MRTVTTRLRGAQHWRHSGAELLPGASGCRAPVDRAVRRPPHATGSAAILGGPSPAPHGPRPSSEDHDEHRAHHRTRRRPRRAATTARGHRRADAARAGPAGRAWPSPGLAVAGAAGLTACGAEGAVERRRRECRERGVLGRLLRSLLGRVRRGGRDRRCRDPGRRRQVFEALKVVVTQPTAGEFKAFAAMCTHQACTVDGRRGRRHHLPVPRQPVRHRDRRGHARARPRSRSPRSRSRSAPTGSPSPEPARGGDALTCPVGRRS